MRNTWIRVALAVAALSVSAGVTASAAKASTPGTPSPDVLSVPCSSGTVWLRLWGPGTTEHCYTGNGFVSTPLLTVTREQIAGVHTVCLSGPGINRACATGPADFYIVPAQEVAFISITTIPAQT
jgi:hypothetical protein